MGGASAGAGLVSLVSSLESVGPYIKGIIQQSGDALGPTTGFMPPTEVLKSKYFDIFYGIKNCFSGMATHFITSKQSPVITIVIHLLKIQ